MTESDPLSGHRTDHAWHLDDLMLFCSLVEAGGYSAASRALGIPKARLSRRVTSLETGLGVRLIERTTRSFHITEVGHRLFAHAQVLQREAESVSAIAAAYHASPVGSLRVGCPHGLAEAFASGAAMDFLIAHPQVNLTFDIIDPAVPATFERYDIIILPSRAALPDSTAVAKRILLTAYQLVAAPSLIAAHGHPSAPEDLEAIPYLGWWDAQPRAKLILEQRDLQTEVPVKTRLRTNNLLFVKKAALAGAGFASLPAMLCQREMSEGRLVPILQGYSCQTMRVHACFPSRRSLTAAGRTFLTILEKHVGGLQQP